MDRHDAIFLWPLDGYDRHGQPKIGTPIELYVQWNLDRKEMFDPKGHKITVEAHAVVDRRLEPGGVLWKGTEDEWYGVGSGTGSGDDRELFEIMAYHEIDDVKGRNTLRTIGVARYRSTLPEQS